MYCFFVLMGPGPYYESLAFPIKLGYFARMPTEQETKDELKIVKGRLRYYDLLEAKILIHLSKGPQRHDSLMKLFRDPNFEAPERPVLLALGSLVEKKLIEPHSKEVGVVDLVRELRDPVEP